MPKEIILITVELFIIVAVMAIMPIIKFLIDRKQIKDGINYYFDKLEQYETRKRINERNFKNREN